jgi:UDP-2-acetamido-3-amino-2,3-dideoxy-glucuronate N-acetyltransferase
MGARPVMSGDRFPGVRVHPSALIEDEVRIGEGSAIWDNVHIRHGSRVGTSCILGEKTYVAYDVSIGDRCKLNAAVYVCAGVSIADDCMLSAHVVFTNDLFPRAFDRSPGALATSDPTEETLSTTVERGVTIGANATIGPGLRLGEFCMVGMGAVVTRDVPPHGLVLGNPARLVAMVCTCGPRIATLDEWRRSSRFDCDRCGRKFERRHDRLVETGPARADGGA